MAAEHASNSHGRNRADHLKPYRWAPGQSGNPNGRPMGTSLTDCIRAILNRHLDDGRLAVEALAEAGVKAALAGDYRFWNAILERVDGKVRDSVQGSDDEPTQTIVQYVITGMEPDELPGDE